VLNKLIKVINSEDAEETANISLIVEKLCIIIEGYLAVYLKASRNNRKIVCSIMKTLILSLYVIYYNIERPEKIIAFFKLNYFTLINTLKKVINIFKEDEDNKEMAHFIINICFDDMKKKIYDYNDDKLAEVYQKHVYAEILGLFPSFNEPFDSKDAVFLTFMKNIREMKMDDYIGFKKLDSDIFCRNLIPLLLTTPNFDFVSFYINVVNKHIEIIRKEYDNELTSLFRKDDVTNDLVKNLIFIFGNHSFARSFYLIIPNEYLSLKEIVFKLEPFEQFFRNFITNLTETLPFIIKVLLKIINTCIKKINSGEEDYNVIYTVLIFNFFISPTILEIYGISLVKYKSLRQLTRILRNICFGKEFDAKDKLSYFNKIIKKLNSFINEQIKKNIFDTIDIEKDKDSINNELSTILVNKKNTHLIRGDKSILMPTFSYQHYWGNISKVLNSVKNKNK
jgi:hypothetical protein